MRPTCLLLDYAHKRQVYLYNKNNVRDAIFGMRKTERKKNEQIHTPTDKYIKKLKERILYQVEKTFHVMLL